MSSHREAPSISKDPVADNTDLYAFVSPGNTVSILANYIPLEEPAGGPNFNQFGDDVLYEVMIDNNGDTFLYNTGPITSLTDPAWNMRQSYSVTKVLGRRRTGRAAVLASGLASPPVRVGPRSTPNYPVLAGGAPPTPPPRREGIG